MLGIGPLWREKGLNDSDADGDPCDDSYLKNSHAQQEWETLGCSGPLPVECRQEGEAAEGTNGKHWDEACLTNELMTGFIPTTTNESTPLSKITIGSLKDLGYEVDFDTADPFSISDLQDCPLFCPEAGLGRSDLASANEAQASPSPKTNTTEEAMEDILVSGYKIVTQNQPLNTVISSPMWAELMSQGINLV